MKLSDVAQLVGGELVGSSEVEIIGVAPIGQAGPGDLTFVANPRYRPLLKTTKAAAAIVDAQTEWPALSLIRHPNPYYAFLLVLRQFHPDEKPVAEGVHPQAFVAPDAVLGQEVGISPFAVVESGAKIGDRTLIAAGCYVGRDVEIGEGCLFHPNVTIRERVKIGNRVIIHSGTVVGSDGFGYAKEKGVYHKIPQVGTVVIEDDVELGANVTIDRATMGETRIGKGTKIDNLVQIAHNVKIGENSIIVSQVGISGSTEVGKNVTIAGQVGLTGHLHIGDGAIIAAQSGVHRDVKPGQIVLGSPAREMQKGKRIEAIISNLPEYIEKLKKLEKAIFGNKHTEASKTTAADQQETPEEVEAK
ncbi:MAG: UDP-3-O-(3-hydroxymyristoyl)glucosamine N-acyltransferase [candidate division Zixibacteria bacterium]|nr:UDP-3-O-(3-hydroxymyristoyl)glucosamine N-acyltransferase [candidate division Zixibacteria bacterium]MCI0595105.1 UDP-3-O-(3-hydroxymyristoyl)glucosamine N-acyltransferase [candidate division Zixibacteria bacterium]